MDRKHIILLIGQKGSGKSFIGMLIEQHFWIPFVRVEDWAKHVKRDRDVFDDAYVKAVFEVIEAGIRERLLYTDVLVFESTGLTAHFDRMLENLKRDYRVTTIGVHAESATCLARVRARDQSIHIKVSDDDVERINTKVRERALKTDFTIINDGKSSISIIEELSNIINSDRRK